MAGLMGASTREAGCTDFSVQPGIVAVFDYQPSISARVRPSGSVVPEKVT